MAPGLFMEDLNYGWFILLFIQTFKVKYVYFSLKEIELIFYL